MSDDLGPPPPPKKVKMPPMTEADKKKLGISAGGGGGGGGGGGAKPVASVPAGGAMVAGPMMGSPMCTPMMGGGYPGIGGMGPNLVFNFSQPYGYGMAACTPVAIVEPKKEEKKEAKEEEKEKAPEPVYVQADPTWRNPRVVQKKGKPLKKEPCVIQ